MYKSVEPESGCGNQSETKITKKQNVILGLSILSLIFGIMSFSFIIFYGAQNHQLIATHANKINEKHKSEPQTKEKRKSEPQTKEKRHSEPQTKEKRHSEPQTKEKRHSETQRKHVTKGFQPSDTKLIQDIEDHVKQLYAAQRDSPTAINITMDLIKILKTNIQPLTPELEKLCQKNHVGEGMKVNEQGIVTNIVPQLKPFIDGLTGMALEPAKKKCEKFIDDLLNYSSYSWWNPTKTIILAANKAAKLGLDAMLKSAGFIL